MRWGFDDVYLPLESGEGAYQETMLLAVESSLGQIMVILLSWTGALGNANVPILNRQDIVAHLAP